VWAPFSWKANTASVPKSAMMQFDVTNGAQLRVACEFTREQFKSVFTVRDFIGSDFILKAALLTLPSRPMREFIVRFGKSVKRKSK
jgi:hypothetical protein